MPLLLAIAAVFVVMAAAWMFRGKLTRGVADAAPSGASSAPAPAATPLTQVVSAPGSVPAPLPSAPHLSPADALLGGLMDAVNPAAPFKLAVESQVYQSQLDHTTCIGLTVTADADCYMLIVDRDSSGKVNVLLPNGVVDHCPLIGRGQSMTVQSLGFEMPVEAPFGRTTFKVIATKRRIVFDGAEPNSAKFLEDVRALSLEDHSAAATAIDKLLGPGEWNAAQVDVVTHAPN
jgi:hypothetical protein